MINKKKAIKKFQSHEKDTGSVDVQVAVISEKISRLTDHLNEHKQDNDSRLGLLKAVSARRTLLSYYEKKDSEKYKKLISKLGLRK